MPCSYLLSISLFKLTLIINSSPYRYRGDPILDTIFSKIRLNLRLRTRLLSELTIEVIREKRRGDSTIDLKM